MILYQTWLFVTLLVTPGRHLFSKIDGLGHTAIIHTYNSTLIEAFTARMPVSRILVNSPGTQGGIGMTSGLIPSLTLGCGTFGGTSTTDNVTYSHLLNIKRVAYYTPPSTLTLVGRMRSLLKRKLLPFA